MKKIFLLFLVGILLISSLNFISAVLTNTTMLNDTFESGNLNLWTDNGATDWDLSSTRAVSPTNSVECSSDDNDLLSDDLDMSDASNIFISFSYWVTAIDANDDVILYYWDGTAYDSIIELGTQTAGQWNNFSVNTLDSQYFDNGFHIYIEGSSIDAGESIQIDDVLIKKETTLNYAPNITNITASHSIIKGGNTLTIYANTTSHGINDTEQSTLYLYCDISDTPTLANTDCTGGTTTDTTYPYVLTCTFPTVQTSTTYTEFCRIYDGTSYSSAVNVSYTTDSTAPTTSIVSVAGDVTPSYFDTANDGRTNITISGEASMSCRWSSSDVDYSSMSNDCITGGTQANCSVTDALTQGFITRYVSCQDQYGNEQNSSNNLNVQFYLDYTAPTTSDNSNINIQAPNYIVTMTEADNVDSDPTTYYCTSSTEGCNPTTLIDNFGTITYTSANRGANYLRYYSIDDAGNSQTIINKTININQLPIFTSAIDDSVTIKGGTIINVSTVSSEPDSQQLNLFVCNSASATSSGCSGTQYCTATGTANLSCIFSSESDSAVHIWYAYIYDDSDEAATENPLTGSYTTDTTAPSITIISPSNGSTITQGSVTFTIILDKALTNAWYSLDSGVNNVTMTNTSLYVYTHSNTSIANGNYNLTVWVNDSYGNIADLSGNSFIIDNTAIDTTAPVITIWSPGNNSYYISASVLLNITSDEALSWAGYIIDGGSITNLDNTTSFNWNKTLTSLTEGQHNISIYANDSSSNKNSANKSIGIYVDLTNPSVEIFSCNDSNDSIDVVCSVSVSDAIGLDYAIIEYNATGTWINSSQIDINGVSSNLNYTIGAGNTTMPGFTTRIYLYDNSGRLNDSSFDYVNTYDNTFPTIGNITYSPNTSDALDPYVTVNVNSTVVEDYQIDVVNLMWQNLSDGDWISVIMTNNSAIANGSSAIVVYNASFIPGNGTYEFKINATDLAGNSNVSNSTTIIAINESGFWNSTNIPLIKSFTSSQRSNNSLLGIIYLNNTGDENLNFNLSTDASSLQNRLNINYTNDDNATYSLSSGSNVSLTILINTTGLNSGLYPYNITIVSQAGTEILEKYVYIQSTEAPYLQISVDTFSSTVTTAQSGVSYVVSVTNLGTQDASNVVLTWTLPSIFTLASGNLTRSFSNIPIGSSGTNTISVNVGSSTTDDIYYINTSATASNADSVNTSRAITVSNPVTIIQIVNTGGSGGSSSGGGGGGAESNKTTYKKIIEMVRGKEDSFNLEIYNPFSNSTLTNIVINFTGILSKYIKTNPIVFDSLSPKERVNLTVDLKIPSYKGSYEEQELKAYLFGENNYGEDYEEIQNILLIIEEISREDTVIALEQAQRALEEMSKNRFNTKEVQFLIKQAQERLDKRRNKEAFDFSQQIIEINKTAFNADSLIVMITEALNNPRKMDLISGNVIKDYGAISIGKVIFDSESTRDILDMANAAFERGDYKTALERAKAAQVMLVLERKGNFALFIYLYWYFIVGGFIMLSIFGILGYKSYQKSSISRKIKDMDRKEDNISILIKGAQKNYFGGKMSQLDYYKTLTNNQNKIAEIKKFRTSLRNKRIRLLQGRELISELNNERIQVENLIKKLQTDFYVLKKISEPEYKTQFSILNERLAEIEEERSTINIMEKRVPTSHSNFYAKEKSFEISKILKGIGNLMVFPFKYFKNLKYKIRMGNEAKMKEKIKHMLEKK